MKKNIIIVCALVVIVGTAFGARQYVHKGELLSKSGKPSAITEYSSMPNYGDDSILLGDSHNVFVGKVVSIVGTRPAISGEIASAPSVQYAVDVILNVKGNVNGTVTVNQFKITSPLVDVGSTYIFAARYNVKENWYISTIYPYDYQLLTDDQGLTDNQLKILAENSDRIKGLQTAYPNEHLGSDVRDNTTWNSYASRHYDANGQLIDDTVALHEQYMAGHPDGSTEPAASAPSDTVRSPDASVSPSDASSPSPLPTEAPLAS
jgi:hypothetical protein